MIDIAQSSNCRVIGEGVEVREEYLVAQSMDMHFAQGYYFDAQRRIQSENYRLNYLPNVRPEKRFIRVFPVQIHWWEVC